METTKKDKRPLIRVMTINSDEAKSYIEDTFSDYIIVTDIEREGVMTKPVVIEITIDDVGKIGELLYETEMMRISTHSTEIQVLYKDSLIGLYYWESWSDGCFDEDVLWSEDAWKYVEEREEIWREKLSNISVNDTYKIYNFVDDIGENKKWQELGFIDAYYELLDRRDETAGVELDINKLYALMDFFQDLKLRIEEDSERMRRRWAEREPLTELPDASELESHTKTKIGN